MRKLLVGVLCAATMAVVAAQEPQTPQAPQTRDPIQEPTFRTGVDLLAIDVSVVDRRGQPVEDLLAPEFSVKIDGEVRRVVSAELVKLDVEAARKQVADKTESFYTSNLTPPNGRQIVLAVDQIHIRPGSLRPVLDAASRFLDQLSPLDQIAFIAYPEPGPRVNFTTDKLRLRRAMQGLVGHQPISAPGQYNIGVAEAMAIENRRDQLTLIAVVNRECRNSNERARLQCESDISDEASRIVRLRREETDQSLIGLRQLLERLALVDGPKSLILLSEGLAIDDSDELRSIVRLAGAARTSINVLLVDLQRGDVTITALPPTEVQDRRLQVQGLEALATMSRGSLFHVAGTGEPIFDRLASELAAYYLLGVEQRPGDGTGDRHRIDIEVRRADVSIRSRQAFVLSPAATRARRSPEQILSDALTSPFAVSGLPVRVTTFAQQDPGSDKVRLMIAAQIGKAGAPPGTFTVGYVVIDDQNRAAASFLEETKLSSGAGSPNEPLRFVGGVLLDPGIYSLRFGAVDAEGRRGSVVRDVSAWQMAGEAFAMGDLILGNAPPPGESVLVQVEPHVTTEALAAYLELYSTSEPTWTGSTVTFEIADDQDSPALATLVARMAPGRQPTWRVASGVLGTRALPPGRYVARAQIARDGKPVGVLARPFVLERDPSARRIPPEAVAAASISFASSLPKFDPAALLGRDLLGSMLDVVAGRSPDLKDAIVEAREGRYGAAALEAFGAGDQTVAAFLRGIDLFAKGQLDQAATQLQVAAGPRREFFPAALYLGAVFAAVGRDRDAAGVWQMALGTDPRPPAVYAMVADARLRTGQPASAIDILKPAYERDPTRVEIARRLAMAYVMTGQYADAVPVLDGYLLGQPADQEMLLAAIVSQYETVRAGQVLSNVDRAKLRAYSVAYKGPDRALIDKYLETMAVR